jgi:branched-chain amino acid transport system substrate-binding protein
MCRLAALAMVMLAATLGGPVRADILIGVAGPLTGKNAWFGEQMERGAGLAVTTGGVLGQQVQLITADHFGCRAAGVPRVG